MEHSTSSLPPGDAKRDVSRWCSLQCANLLTRHFTDASTPYHDVPEATSDDAMSLADTSSSANDSSGDISMHSPDASQTYPQNASGEPSTGLPGAPSAGTEYTFRSMMRTMFGVLRQISNAVVRLGNAIVRLEDLLSQYERCQDNRRIV